MGLNDIKRSSCGDPRSACEKPHLTHGSGAGDDGGGKLSTRWPESARARATSVLLTLLRGDTTLGLPLPLSSSSPASLMALGTAPRDRPLPLPPPAPPRVPAPPPVPGYTPASSAGRTPRGGECGSPPRGDGNAAALPRRAPASPLFRRPRTCVLLAKSLASILTKPMVATHQSDCSWACYNERQAGVQPAQMQGERPRAAPRVEH